MVMKARLNLPKAFGTCSLNSATPRMESSKKGESERTRGHGLRSFLCVGTEQCSSFRVAWTRGGMVLDDARGRRAGSCFKGARSESGLVGWQRGRTDAEDYQ